MNAFSLALLLLSWPLWSLSLYTHWPDTGWQDLFLLSEPQHQQLAEKLQLTSGETQLWLQELQQALASEPCEHKVEAIEVTFNAESVLVSNRRGLLHFAPASGPGWWYLPWHLFDRLPNPHQATASALMHTGQTLFAEHAAGLYVVNLSQPQLGPGWHYDLTELRLLMVSPAAVLVARQQQLQWLDPMTGGLMAQWQFQQQVEWAGMAGPSVLLSTVDQQIWRLNALTEKATPAELVVNLSQLGSFVVRQLQLIDAMVPLQPAAGMHWRRPSQVLLLSAEKEGGAMLLMLRLNHGSRHQPKLIGQQQDRLMTEAEFQQLLDADGWYSEFAAPLYADFTLAAGVWYQQLALQHSGPCATQPAAVSLLALHLHYGTAVYSSRQLSSDQVARQLKASVSGRGFALQDAGTGEVVLPELLEIKAHCAQCSSPLLVEHFPRQKLLAVYQTEHGGQE